ncbi:MULTISPECIES: fimbrial protein [Erwiniaceae]|uniref:Type 1 fimbrial protein n=3 Tax=Erwiniaceae TaxID=1903409 RepID=A0ACC5PWB1_ENTAG|nr:MULTISPECIES: fimbrial protein [Erwiniaceae]MBD8109344.1 type 1 fimbrial protein [Erwinia persicina]MBD8129164.1 type 1 fimbrial protein [Pantoea agglomerans]MBD8212492.1 type 1 fimbrial protein [Erwinia persicina]MBD8234819.1 type 1 fimbrial protein [Pantoea agglomerans]MBD8245233.1 type 1 fimbrial protein [Pantoea agglomerans]
MKKIGTVSMTGAALLAASWGAQATDASDTSPAAQVHFTATVTGNTCTPEWTLGSKMEVPFGKIADTTLATVGDVGSTQPFTLSLKNCDSGIKKVAVSALGTADGSDKKAFANTAASSGAASGVAVTLWGGSDHSTQLTPDATSQAEYKVTDGAAAMSFVAKLERSAAVGEKGTKDGSVESIANLYLDYE